MLEFWNLHRPGPGNIRSVFMKIVCLGVAGARNYRGYCSKSVRADLIYDFRVYLNFKINRIITTFFLQNILIYACLWTRDIVGHFFVRKLCVEKMHFFRFYKCIRFCWRSTL